MAPPRNGRGAKRLQIIRSRVQPVASVQTIFYSLVWGRVKSGKTQFATTAPKPIMFTVERGEDTVRSHPDLQVFPFNPGGKHRKVKWQDAWDLAHLLRHDDQLDRESVVIDTLTALVTKCARYLVKDEEERDEQRIPKTMERMTWGRLAIEVTDWMEEMETICYTRGLNLIYLAQERFREDEETGERYVTPAFPPSIMAYITQKPSVLARTFVTNEEGEEVEVDDDAKEEKLKYGMIFRDPDLMVGVREDAYSPGAKLPAYAYNVTVPKVIRRMRNEGGTRATTKKKVRNRNEG